MQTGCLVQCHWKLLTFKKFKKIVWNKIFKSSGSRMTKIKKSKKKFCVECQTKMNIVLGDLFHSQCPQGCLVLQIASSSDPPHSDKPLSLPPTDLKNNTVQGLLSTCKNNLFFFFLRNGRNWKPLKVLSRQENKNKMGSLAFFSVQVIFENFLFLVKIYLRNLN